MADFSFKTNDNYEGIVNDILKKAYIKMCEENEFNLSFFIGKESIQLDMVEAALFARDYLRNIIDSPDNIIDFIESDKDLNDKVHNIINKEEHKICIPFIMNTIDNVMTTLVYAVNDMLIDYSSIDPDEYMKEHNIDYNSLEKDENGNIIFSIPFPTVEIILSKDNNDENNGLNCDKCEDCND